MSILVETCAFWLAFDRGRVAQAIVDGMTIGIPDPLVRAYPAPTLW